MLGLKQVHHIAIIATVMREQSFLLRYSWFHAAKLKSIAKRATRGKGIWRLMDNM